MIYMTHGHVTLTLGLGENERINVTFLLEMGVFRACRIYGLWGFMGINFLP